MKEIRSVRVENATNVRKKFLKIIDGDFSYIISKGSSARAVLMPVEVYEKLVAAGREKLPALAVLGAKNCGKKKAQDAITNINRSEKYFSKIIFVHGEKTASYADYFKVGDLRIVLNGKPHLPVITSMKLAVAALSADDDFIVFCFLSKPSAGRSLKKMSEKIISAGKKKKGIVITKINGRPSHPIAFSGKYFKRILSTRKELGIPYIVRKFKKDIMYV